MVKLIVDNNSNMAKTVGFIFVMAEKFLKKEYSDIGHQQFSPVPTLFSNVFFHMIIRNTRLSFKELTGNKNLDWSKSKQIADDILKCI